MKASLKHPWGRPPKVGDSAPDGKRRGVTSERTDTGPRQVPVGSLEKTGVTRRCVKEVVPDLGSEPLDPKKCKQERKTQEGVGTL